jgi:hypothetical protein
MFNKCELRGPNIQYLTLIKYPQWYDLSMRIIRDRANGTLKVSQTEYVKKVLNGFSID